MAASDSIEGSVGLLHPSMKTVMMTKEQSVLMANLGWLKLECCWV